MPKENPNDPYVTKSMFDNLVIDLTSMFSSFVEHLDERFDKLEGRMGKLEGRLDKVENKLDSAIAHNKVQDAKIEGVELWAAQHPIYG